MSKGLASLRKFQKCQRRVAKGVLRAAKAGKHPRSAELKRAANALASIACSKGTRGKTKRTRTKGGVPYDVTVAQADVYWKRKGKRRSRKPQTGAERMPGPYAPPPRPFPYDDNWGY